MTFSTELGTCSYFKRLNNEKYYFLHFPFGEFDLG